MNTRATREAWGESNVSLIFKKIENKVKHPEDFYLKNGSRTSDNGMSYELYEMKL